MTTPELSAEPRVAVVIRSSAWLGIAAHAGFIPLFWLTGYPLLAPFNVRTPPKKSLNACAAPPKRVWAPSTV